MRKSVPYLSVTLCAPYAGTPRMCRGGSVPWSHTYTKFSSKLISRHENNASMLLCSSCALHLDKVCLAPDPILNWISSKAIGFNFLRNISCMLFRSLIRFDALLGLGGNLHCLPIRVGRSRDSVVANRAIVPDIYSAIRLQLFPANIWMSLSSTRVVTSSVLPHYILGHEILKIDLPNQMKNWTVGTILIPCDRSPELGKRRHGVSGPNVSFSSLQYFH